MSTKLRPVLISKVGDCYTGGKALWQMNRLMAFNAFNPNLPPNWMTMKKFDKLEFLSDRLPNNWQLILFREPKNLRGSKSNYRKLVKEIKNSGKIPKAFAFPVTVAAAPPPIPEVFVPGAMAAPVNVQFAWNAAVADHGYARAGDMIVQEPLPDFPEAPEVHQLNGVQPNGFQRRARLRHLAAEPAAPRVRPLNRF
jgi:hypothetical protein